MGAECMSHVDQFALMYTSSLHSPSLIASRSVPRNSSALPFSSGIVIRDIKLANCLIEPKGVSACVAARRHGVVDNGAECLGLCMHGVWPGR